MPTNVSMASRLPPPGDSDKKVPVALSLMDALVEMDDASPLVVVVETTGNLSSHLKWRYMSASGGALGDTSPTLAESPGDPIVHDPRCEIKNDGGSLPRSGAVRSSKGISSPERGLGSVDPRCKAMSGAGVNETKYESEVSPFVEMKCSARDPPGDGSLALCTPTLFTQKRVAKLVPWSLAISTWGPQNADHHALRVLSFVPGPRTYK